METAWASMFSWGNVEFRDYTGFRVSVLEFNHAIRTGGVGLWGSKGFGFRHCGS